MAASNKVGEAYVEIRTDDAPLTKGLSAAKAKTQQWAAGIGAVTGKLGAALAVGGFALSGLDNLKSAIMSASDLGETMSKTTVVFGDATAKVTAFADEMVATFGSNKQEILDAASSLGLIGKAAGMSKDQAAAMSIAMSRLADDASSFYNVPLAEALDTIRSALVGESEPIRKFGVLLNEDAVKAEAFRLGLAKTSGQLTEQAKVMARVSLIQKGMTDATGDHARTMDSFSNKIREIGGRLKNIATELGRILLPIVSAVASVFNVVAMAIEKVAKFVGRLADGFRELAGDAATAGGVIAGPVGAAVGYISDQMGKANKKQEEWLAAKAAMDANPSGTVAGKNPRPTIASGAVSAADATKAINDKATMSIAADKEADLLKKRIEAIQEEQRLEVKKEANRKVEIEILKARSLDSWLIKEKGADGKIRDVVPEARRADVDGIMKKYPNPEVLMSAGKDKLSQVLGIVSQLKQTALSGAAIGAEMLLNKPRGVLTGVGDAESYRQSAQNSILSGERGDNTQKQLLLESQKQVSELKAIKESLMKQGKSAVAAVFG